MGFFTSKKIFSSSQQIKDALISIRSLDHHERSLVFENLKQELDGGGVTAAELKEVVRKLRQDKKISEVDRKNLLEFLD